MESALIPVFNAVLSPCIVASETWILSRAMIDLAMKLIRSLSTLTNFGRTLRRSSTWSGSREHGPNIDCGFRSSSRRSASSCDKLLHELRDRHFECLVRDRNKLDRWSIWQCDPKRL